MTIPEIQAYLRGRDVDLRYFPFQVAKDTSALAAVLLYDLHGRISRQRKPLIRDRLQWTFDPMRVFAEDHPYAKESGIRKAFLALEAAGLIKIEDTGKYNRKGYDGKWWYHVTPRGMKQAGVRRIRFAPNVAAALDIPKAALLEHFRHELHGAAAGEYVKMEAAELRLPYHPKTIGRHLEALVKLGVLEVNPADKDEYRIASPKPEHANWRTQRAPITVAPGLLLPDLQPGEVGLLTAHSGSGKTSLSTFVTAQFAFAGSKVLYLSLEEPVRNIADRIYAQEFGVSYTDLHAGRPAAVDEVNSGIGAKSYRKSVFGNLKVMDLSGGKVQTHEIQDTIHQVIQGGFQPDVVIIDQLEYISVEVDEDDDQPDPAPAGTAQSAPALSVSSLGIAVPPALLVRECLGEPRTFITWVLHQVVGECSIHFCVKDIAGGVDVADQFDCVVGIGRATQASQVLRAFSLTPSRPFDRVIDAHFPFMRFMPRK